ncbi:phosphoadenylyl-sulfate reductase [Rhabdaerophilum calidifontis]|uniref:phosphoadenylyl-sulfate reductase n=1 Tax=Rhabdaerophilum calidifontis TaxID=2604328 RepID=UPI00123B1084|nr:phosphoadenylyl-sulfate reductase [Rhabdaerophilum calidifontis]
MNPGIHAAGPDSAAALAATLAPLAPAERLRTARAAIGGRLVLTTSFGLEDQVLTHLVAGAGLAITLATLDTGRLHPETYALWCETETRYGLRIAAFYPRHDAIEGYVLEHGIDGFYASITARKACCGIRKVEPLGRALAGAAGWITGLRADQSAAREATPFAEWDAGRGLIKLNPLADWSRPALLAFAEREGVPLNPLHAQGFPSIGCAPCTRAVQPGEPERAGRWWWENEAAKECGLHVGPDGRLVRATRREEVPA